MVTSIMIGSMAYTGNGGVIFMFHFLWLPSLLFIFKQKELFLWGLNQLMIALVIWD